MTAHPLNALLDRFDGRHVLVVGDAILDHYLVGNVSRTSPEAPVPVLNVDNEEYLAGGAANVARNIAALGARATYVAIVGDDESGTRLQKILQATRGISFQSEVVRGRVTPLKTRCVAQGQQMLRFDREVSVAPPLNIEARLLKRIHRILPKVDGVILSDYAKGLLTPALITAILHAAHERDLEVVVDPKGTDYSRYRGVDLLTPNRKEAEDASGVRIADEASAAESARRIQSVVKAKAICITLGAAGVAVFPRRGNSLHLHARAREVYDVTGAGDTFIAAMGLARFAGGSFSEAADLANHAAGLSVGRSGVAAVGIEELRRELLGADGQRKWLGLEELAEVRRSLARASRRVVLTNGCFDVLGSHHVHLLAQARALGDVLVVALNSDESVRRIKGDPRPLLTVAERVDLLGALPYVDYLVVYDEDTPHRVLETLRPDFLVKGDNAGEAVGREIVERHGGQVRLLSLGVGPTTREVIRRATGDTKPKASSRSGKKSP